MNLSSISLHGSFREILGGTGDSAYSLPSLVDDWRGADQRHTSNFPRDLLSIVSFALRADIPHETASQHEGVSPPWEEPLFFRPERLDHVLGSGASCTVSLHEVDTDISENVPKGTVVALKRYRSPKSVELYYEQKAQQKLHNQIWQDLQVLTHPYLRDHDNIAKLLYLAWEDQSLVPIFAHEFAEYGTFDRFLTQNCGNPLNISLLSSLSIDVVTGVAALHECEFVHGDIKPTNVLVHKHSTRDFVAKISDFVGAAPVGDFGGLDHAGFGTEAWLAPQVFLNDCGIDWLKADVYALGLLLAYIFYPNALKDDYFLLDLLEGPNVDLDNGDKTQLLRQLKVFASSNEADGGDNLIATSIHEFYIKMLTQQSSSHSGENSDDASKTDQSVLGQNSDVLNVLACLNASLKLDQEARCTSKHLLYLLCASEAAHGIERPFNEGFFTPTQSTSKNTSLGNKLSMLRQEFIFLPSFLQRSREFHRTAVKQLIRSLDTEAAIPDCWLPDLDENEQTNELKVLSWCESNNDNVTVSLTERVDTYRYWWCLAQCYFLGIGVVSNEQYAVEAAALAARGAIATAMAALPNLEASCEPIERDRSYDRPMIWASYAMRYEFHDSKEKLKDEYPQLAETMRSIMVGRKLYSHEAQKYILLPRSFSTKDWYRATLNQKLQTLRGENPCNLSFSIATDKPRLIRAAAGFGDIEGLAQILKFSGKSDINEADESGNTSLRLALASEDNRVVKMLLLHGADPSEHGLLHHVATLDDDSACLMVKTLLEYRVNLNAVHTEGPSWCHNFLNRAYGTPLMWAIWKNRPRLFKVLLTEHHKRSIPIDQFWPLIFQRVAIYHHVDILSNIMSIRTGQDDSAAPRKLVESFRNVMLRWAVHEPSHHSMSCRMQLGSKFYPRQKEFIIYLLQIGANPLGSISSKPTTFLSNALNYAFQCGDKQACELMLHHLSTQGMNPYKILTTSTVENSEIGILSLLNAGCIDGFYWALENYPQLTEKSFQIHGKPLLHFAASFGEPAHVRALLDKGVDPYYTDKNWECTALEVAIESGKLEIGELLIKEGDARKLFGTPSKLGHTLFGRMLNRVFNFRKRTLNETFHWLRRHKGLQFYPNIYTSLSLWHLLFPKRFVARREIIEADLDLLDLLLQPDTFLDRIHETDITGQAVIHYAARWGNSETMRLLLKKGADINQPIVKTAYKPATGPPTATPLDLVTAVNRIYPKDVKAGGMYVMNLWKEERTKLLSFLKANGAKHGLYESLANMALYGIPLDQFENSGGGADEQGEFDIDGLQSNLADKLLDPNLPSVEAESVPDASEGHGYITLKEHLERCLSLASSYSNQLEEELKEREDDVEPPVGELTREMKLIKSKIGLEFQSFIESEMVPESAIELMETLLEDRGYRDYLGKSLKLVRNYTNMPSNISSFQ